MEADWINIAFTAPGSLGPLEARKVQEALDIGAFDILHVRKPGLGKEQLASFISDIDPSFHPRLKLHDHFGLLKEFPRLGGVHLNSRNPQPPPFCESVSMSCHSIEEVESKAAGYEYVTLSPIFDSISKPEYPGRFNHATLPPLLSGKKVIALGGITPRHFFYLKRLGFKGAAMLGHLWSNPLESPLFERACRMAAAVKRMLRTFPLQFVTDGRTPQETIEMVRDAVEGGCRWIQIRMKDSDLQARTKVVDAVSRICSDNDCTLLIDDDVHAAALGNIGIHLGKTDMPTPQAADILGPDAVIGRTANCREDLIALAADHRADYIGLGPFRFTQTKKKLAPVLGLEGYKALIADMRQRNDFRPIVAIGGITPDDVVPLLSAGADGVAVSGAIAHAPDRIAATRSFINEINKHIYYNV